MLLETNRIPPLPFTPQMGIKITNEAPVGIKAGLRASYQWVNQVRAALGDHACQRGPAFLVLLPLPTSRCL